MIFVTEPETEIFYDGKEMALSFPEATPPAMWRFDLSQTAGYQFSIDQNALLFRSAPDAAPVTVAQFAKPEEAGAALRDIMRILTKPYHRARKQRGVWGWIWRAFEWFLMLCGLFFIFLSLLIMLNIKIQNETTPLVEQKLQEKLKEQGITVPGQRQQPAQR